MRVLNFYAENFKRLKVVQITPDGDIVKIGGDNEQGKSSVMDALWVALEGKSVAPPMPIRDGMQECKIVVDMGALVVTRTFKDKEGKITDTVKVESAEGLRYNKPQEVLDALIGSIGFDPFDFAQKKPERQAELLLDLVPLTVDLDEHAELDASDYAKRRDINREIEALQGQLQGMPEFTGLPAELIDTAALIDEIANAGSFNAAIENERLRRDREERTFPEYDRQAQARKDRAAELRKEADALDAQAKGVEEDVAAMRKALADLPPLDEPKDAEAARAKLDDANQTNGKIARQRQRDTVFEDLKTKDAASKELSAKLETRAKERQQALLVAKMPIEGLGFKINEKGKPVVTWQGVPFEQASSAAQIRASTAIAMASNPKLRVLRIKDGSLLGKTAMDILSEMARENDYQLWIEVVGEGEGVGIIMEDGEVRQKESTPKAKDKPTGGEKLL